MYNIYGKEKRELVTNVLLLNILNRTHAPRLLGGHAPPVLIAELDAPVGAQSNCKEEEDGPDASDDETNGEEGKRCAGDNEGSGQEHGGGSCCCCGCRIGV
jgi:hypothetical protein